MKVLVTGASGMLARALLPALHEAGYETVALGRTDLDITDPARVERVITRERPDAVVQCAAYTAVDAAETDYARAFEVNATATGYVAAACHRIGASFVYPSTDYVFDGRGTRPYRPDDRTDPVNAYGRSKLAGERAAAEAERHLVVRTSWLYGKGGANFVDTMLRLGRERDSLQVVDDQIGRPTWTGSLARGIADLLGEGVTGVLHFSDAGEPISWYDLAVEALRSEGIETPAERVSSEVFSRRAPRPGYSVLDCSVTEKKLNRPLPHWKQSLRQHLRGT